MEADALSRYAYQVYFINLMQDNVNYVSTKAIDPYEDAALLEYLKNNNIPNYLSRKQKNIILKTSKKYMWFGDIIWFKINAHNIVEVPRIEERMAFVKCFHDIGHFDARATNLRLKEKYYWKKMFDMCTAVIQACETCLKFNKKPRLEHSALPLKIGGIFDRVSIDFVFGFPKT